MYSHPKSQQVFLISSSLSCCLRMFWDSLDTLNEDPSGDSSAYTMLVFEQATLQFWVISESFLMHPCQSSDDTARIIIYWAPNFKREEVNRYTLGCKLVHNYNFLKDLDVAVMLTCVIQFSHDTQSQSCIQVSIKGSQEPQDVLSKGKERNVQVLWEPQAVFSWDGGRVPKSPCSPPHPSLGCHSSFLHVVWSSWRKRHSLFFCNIKATLFKECNFTETLLLAGEFGTSTEAAIGSFPLSFNKREYLNCWSVITSAGFAQRSSSIRPTKVIVSYRKILLSM